MEGKNPKDELNKKMNFEGVTDNREAFFKESEQFSGNEVEITFKLDYNGDLNGKEFSDTFKEGQDFEYVKYKLSQVLGVEQEQIVKYFFIIFFYFYTLQELYHNNKPIIPIYSICDIELKKEDIIIVKIKPE